MALSALPGRHGHRPVFVGHQVHDHGLVPEGRPLKHGPEGSADEQIPQIDHQHGDDHLRYGERRGPHVHHDELRGTGEHGQIHEQQGRPLHALLHGQHPQHAAVGGDAGRHREIGRKPALHLPEPVGFLHISDSLPSS